MLGDAGSLALTHGSHTEPIILHIDITVSTTAHAAAAAAAVGVRHCLDGDQLSGLRGDSRQLVQRNLHALGQNGLLTAAAAAATAKVTVVVICLPSELLDRGWDVRESASVQMHAVAV